jgi:hypothetical protein
VKKYRLTSEKLKVQLHRLWNRNRKRKRKRKITSDSPIDLTLAFGLASGKQQQNSRLARSPADAYETGAYVYYTVAKVLLHRGTFKK